MAQFIDPEKVTILSEIIVFIRIVVISSTEYSLKSKDIFFKNQFYCILAKDQQQSYAPSQLSPPYSLQTRYARHVGEFYAKRRVCFFEKIQIRTLESKDGSSVTLGKTENPKMDFEHKAMPERIPQIKSEPEFTGLLIRAFLWLLI